MAGFATFDAIVNALTVNLKGQELHFDKAYGASVSNAFPRSLWPSAGMPVAGGNTTSGKANGAVCTSSTTGAMPFTDPTNPATMHLLSIGAWMTANGSANTPYTALLVDRIAHVQLAGNEATGTITGIDATSRLASGEGALIFLETTSASGVSSNTFTFTYTNQAGTGSRTTPTLTTVQTAVGDSFTGAQLWQPLQAGDRGVRSVQSITLISGAGVGAFNLCLVRPLARLFVPTTSSVSERDLVVEVPKLPKIYPASCLQWIVVPGSTAVPRLQGSIFIAEN